MYYLCTENKGADQLCGHRTAVLRLCFRICKKQVCSLRGSKHLVLHPGVACIQSRSTPDRAKVCVNYLIAIYFNVLSSFLRDCYCFLHVHVHFFFFFLFKKVIEKQCTGTGANKRQNPLLKPKREINKYYK